MKLFYKKDYQRVSEKNNDLIEANKIKDETIKSLKKTLKRKKQIYKEKIKSLENEKIEDQILIVRKNEEIAQLSKEKKIISGRLGGTTKEKNKLIKDLEKSEQHIKKLTAEISDLKSDRYLKIECEPDKPGKTQKMQIYSKRRTSGIIKNVKEKL